MKRHIYIFCTLIITLFLEYLPFSYTAWGSEVPTLPATPAVAASLEENVDYGDRFSWAFYGSGAGKDVDIFIIAPSVVKGSPSEPSMKLNDMVAREKFTGALEMELGIYNQECRVYAPFYRQATLSSFANGGTQLDTALTLATADVEKAFDYYIAHTNKNRPFILSGFSQGSAILINLMKDRFADASLQKRLVAAYALGWRLTPEDCARYPYLRPAKEEADTGVIISFNSEAPSISTSLLVPAGTKTLSINPLNWKTDSTPAPASLNTGACFTKYDGKIHKEIPHLCGAYLDRQRGTLKVTGITPEQYPPILKMFSPGIYHLYDYQFFYRNLQANVHTRIAAYTLSSRLDSFPAAS